MMRLEIDSGVGPRVVDLSSYVDADREERGHEAAYRWIKALRHARVDGVPFRGRWAHRGDSLWWFAELYLHKEQVVLALHRTIAAFHAMVEAERPLAVRSLDAKRGWLVCRLAATRGIRHEGPATPPRAWAQVLRLDVRALALETAARAGRIRARPPDAAPSTIAAFVHKAFWRPATMDGSAESYIGPVLKELESRAPSIAYIAVGPRTNFRARRWWDPFRDQQPAAHVFPVEAFAPLAVLKESRDLFRARHDVRRALWRSEDMRARAIIEGCDCWPAIREQLAGIALLQFPWSARVMDEAGAALDALRPRVAVTYAEAGGWGRALALECRRRGIALAALQHGFIYRHWLNYRHEPDEMGTDPSLPTDPGFPLPSVTLVYDVHAARHLVSVARFPATAIRVTGSPRLDELVAAIESLSPERVAQVRQEAGAGDHDAIVLVATKQREASRILPAFIEAVSGMTGVHVVIKPHPAETPAVYESAVAGRPHVRVLPSSAALSDMLAVAAAVVTVNSTVAIDALTLGVPSLVIGLPNNLSPFVERGAMAGANGPEEIRASLERLLYDQEFRHTLLAAAGGTRERSGAASRAAAAVLELAKEATI